MVTKEEVAEYKVKIYEIICEVRGDAFNKWSALSYTSKYTLPYLLSRLHGEVKKHNTEIQIPLQRM